MDLIDQIYHPVIAVFEIFETVQTVILINLRRLRQTVYMDVCTKDRKRIRFTKLLDILDSR